MQFVTKWDNAKEKGLSVRQRAILAQLRCDGHCPILQTYLYRIGKADCDTCIFCQEAPDTLEHCLLYCKNHDNHRQTHLPNACLDDLYQRPEEVVNFLADARRI